MKLPFLVFVSLLTGSISKAQQAISMRNASFEAHIDSTQFFYGSTDWSPCGQKGSLPPRLQPGSLGVDQKAEDGKHYLSLVARPNFTWQSIAQKLTAPLLPGVCYQIIIHLAQSPTLKAAANMKPGQNIREPANAKQYEHFLFSNPLVLQLYAANNDCALGYFLVQTPPIDHADWKRYRLVFQHNSPEPLDYLVFQAYYPPFKRCEGQPGNILIDNLSNIETVSCPPHLGTDTIKASAPEAFYPGSESEWDNLVSDILSRVEYDPKEAFVKLMCLENPNLPMASNVNPYWDELIEHLKRYPEFRIRIAFLKDRKDLRVARTNLLDRYFKANKAPEAQYEILSDAADDDFPPWKFNNQVFSAWWSAPEGN